MGLADVEIAVRAKPSALGPVLELAVVPIGVHDDLELLPVIQVPLAHAREFAQALVDVAATMLVGGRKRDA